MPDIDEIIERLRTVELAVEHGEDAVVLLDDLIEELKEMKKQTEAIKEVNDAMMGTLYADSIEKTEEAIEVMRKWIAERENSLNEEN